VGWQEVLRRERAWLLVTLLLVATAALAALGLWRGDLPLWPMALLAIAALGLLARRAFPTQWDSLWLAVPYALLVPLNLVALFWFVVPQLRP
jgi:hypothetical protein